MNFNRFKKIDDISIKNRYEEAKSLKKLCDVLSKLKMFILKTLDPIGLIDYLDNVSLFVAMDNILVHS